MYDLYIPEGYYSRLSFRDNQRAVKTIKDTFQKKLAQALNLERVTAPLMVLGGCGINDDLNGVERKVSFDIKEIDENAEIVQSLAKWKRMALCRYGFAQGEGLYTDMNAIRRDDDVDNLHSIFVDQWDWERVISKSERNIEFLKETVNRVVGAIVDTNEALKSQYNGITTELSRNVFFITTEELLKMYPDLSPKERENALLKEHRTVFLMQIGGKLSNGERHDGRAPDYDDWNLNGDIIFRNDVLDCAFEVSSMGIRVDSEALKRQLAITGDEDRLKYEYHDGIINNKLPLTIGGGIGQSRLCMLILQKAHIGEVQVSVWPDKMLKECKENNIVIL